MFNNGDRCREIHEVFSTVGNITLNDSVLRQQKPNARCKDNFQEPNNNNIFSIPETAATLLQLLAEIKTSSDKQLAYSEILTEIKSDMKEMVAYVRLIYGATKSILSKALEMSEQSRVDRLQNDVSKISSTLGIINKKLNDQEIKKLPTSSNKLH